MDAALSKSNRARWEGCSPCHRRIGKGKVARTESWPRRQTGESAPPRRTLTASRRGREGGQWWQRWLCVHFGHRSQMKRELVYRLISGKEIKFASHEYVSDPERCFFSAGILMEKAGQKAELISAFDAKAQNKTSHHLSR